MSVDKDTAGVKGTRAAAKGAKPMPLETRSGDRLEVEFVSNVYVSGRATVIQCNIRDITEQRRAEAKIRQLNCGLIERGRAADFVFMDKAQHSAGAGLLESVQLGDIPGVGMVMIDGIVRCGRSRNTPPATEIPVVV